MSGETNGVRVLDPPRWIEPHLICSTILKVQLHHENAKLPTKAYPRSAGYDLYAASPVEIPSKGQGVVELGLSVGIQYGYYGQIAPRSSLALRGIAVGGGVIDSGYNGPVKVILYNHNPESSYKINVGDRVAQMIIIPCPHFKVEKVESLDETQRGEGGFGSTGK